MDEDCGYELDIGPRAAILRDNQCFQLFEFRVRCFIPGKL